MTGPVWKRAALALILGLGLVGGVHAQSPFNQETIEQDFGALDLDSLTVAASQDDAAAQLALATRYHTGTGVVQNFARAAEWYARAANLGNAQAQNQLGRYYHTGLGVPADRTTALTWLAAAADQGTPEHVFDLAVVLEEATDDPEVLTRAAVLYARAAKAGHIEATVSLGVMYQNGIGVARDPARAFVLYQGPAEAGNARALNNLGLLYVRGSGVPQDYDRAAQLFAAAADRGLQQAIGNLGVMYENGFGVAQSDTEAARLYRLAGADAAQEQLGFVYDPRLTAPPSEAAGINALRTAAVWGDPVAQFQMGWLLVHLTAPAFTDWRDAATLFAAAATSGHSASMANLGVLYMKGRGVPQDYVKAQMWVTLAGSIGLEAATPLSAALRARMTPDQINEAQAQAEARRASGPLRLSNP